MFETCALGRPKRRSNTEASRIKENSHCSVSHLDKPIVLRRLHDGWDVGVRDPEPAEAGNDLGNLLYVLSIEAQDANTSWRVPQLLCRKLLADVEAC